MHDIDRVRLEIQPQSEIFETGPHEAEQFEQMEAFEFGEAEGEASALLGETEQMELASELLEISSEAELDRFLGGLINRVGQAAGRFVSSPEGRAVGGVLKNAARQVLPAIGAPIGHYFGGARGARIGRDAAALAGSIFGLETEGLSAEDREFELARRFIDFAVEAVRRMLTGHGGDPRATARRAVMAAAHAYAPGWARRSPTTGRAPAPQAAYASPVAKSGRWMRRGRKIVLYGI
jgi:hypothetical protein